MAKRWLDGRAELKKIPDEFFLETLRALREANRMAAAACRHLDSEWRTGAFAHLRRENFNQLWKAAARRSGARARSVLNANNATFHLEVTLGGIIFTPIAVQGPNEFPPDCEYRSNLAAWQQLSLLPSMGIPEEAPPPDARLYAVFAYSSDVEEESGLPVFAFIGFPHPKKRKYAAEPYSLLKLINELGKPSGGAPLPMDVSPPPAPDSDAAAAGFEEERIDEEPLTFIGKRSEKLDRENE